MLYWVTTHRLCGWQPELVTARMPVNQQALDSGLVDRGATLLRKLREALALDGIGALAWVPHRPTNQSSKLITTQASQAPRATPKQKS
jgi:hypothetical protein